METPEDVEITQNTICDETSNAADADLALVCTCPTPTGNTVDSIKQQVHIFKVHRKVLAAPSTFFEDMLAASGVPDDIDEQGNSGNLPIVKMEERRGSDCPTGCSVQQSRIVRGIGTNPRMEVCFKRLGGCE